MLNSQQLQQMLGGINTQALLGKMLQGMSNNKFATGVVAGGIANAVLGKGDGVGKSAMKMGGLAVLGSLAMNALQQYRQNPQAITGMLAGAGGAAGGLLDNLKGMIAGAVGGNAMQQGGFQGLPANAQPQDDAQAANLAVSMIRAMIAAAKADGQIDASENSAIFGQLEQAGLDASEKSFLIQEMAKPTDFSSIAAGIANQEQAAQVYAAALAVAGDSNAAEQGFLGQLAQALNLEAGLVQVLHGQVNAIKQAA